MNAVILGLWLLMGATNSAGEANPRFDASQLLNVRFQEGRLSLHSIQRPWHELLQEIRDKTGMRFHHAFPLEGSVSVSITALPMLQAVERLFGPEASFMFRYPAGVSGSLAVPLEVWILGAVHDRGAKAATQAELGSGDLALLAPEEQERFTELAEAEIYPVVRDAEISQHLSALTQDEDPIARVQALSALAQTDKAEAAEWHIALDAALHNKEASVRGAAFQALASRGGPEATRRLFDALLDPDAGVRILAVESASRAREGQALLEEALSDKDETVRLMAAERLQQAQD